MTNLDQHLSSRFIPRRTWVFACILVLLTATWVYKMDRRRTASTYEFSRGTWNVFADSKPTFFQGSITITEISTSAVSRPVALPDTARWGSFDLRSAVDLVSTVRAQSAAPSWSPAMLRADFQVVGLGIPIALKPTTVSVTQRLDGPGPAVFREVPVQQGIKFFWHNIGLLAGIAISLVGAAHGLRRGLTNRHRLRAGKCVACGYSLQGIAANTCPECGSAGCTG